MCHFRLAVFGLVCLGWATAIWAMDGEAESAKEYRLGPKEGPFMIYIASFRGDQDNGPTAREQARTLVSELRSRYKLQAFMFSRSEQEQAARDKQLKDMHERLGEDQYFKKTRIVPEWAVLIGSWSDRDSATKYLYDYIKGKPDKTTGISKAKLPPPQSVHGPSTFIYRSPQEMKAKGKGAEAAFEKEEHNVFERAWVVRNPLLTSDTPPNSIPAEEDIASKLETYNLERCPKQFTMVVKNFAYDETLASREGGSKLSNLNPFAAKEAKPVVGRKEAAAAAVRLAQALQAQVPGNQVYLWPTKRDILVTVGGFNLSAQNLSTDNKEWYTLYAKLANAKIGNVQLLEEPQPLVVPKGKPTEK